MLGETSTHVNDLLDDAPPAKGEAQTRDEVRSWLLDYLRGQGGTAPAADVLDEGQEAGMYSKDQLKRAKTDIGARSVKTAAGWNWELPDTSGPTTREVHP